VAYNESNTSVGVRYHLKARNHRQILLFSCTGQFWDPKIHI